MTALVTSSTGAFARLEDTDLFALESCFLSEEDDMLEDPKLSPADFQVAVTQLPIAALIVDGNGIVIDMNDQFSSRIGYSRADLVGRPVNTIVPDRIRSRHDALLQTYFQNPTVRSMGTRASNVAVVLPSGKEVEAEIALYPCPNKDCAAALISLKEEEKDPFWRNFFISVAMIIVGILVEMAKSKVPSLESLPDGDLIVGAGSTLLAQQTVWKVRKPS